MTVVNSGSRILSQRELSHEIERQTEGATERRLHEIKASKEQAAALKHQKPKP